MMMHATSDQSDVTSITPSSTSSSPAAYYVQSPSRDSHDEADKCSSSNCRSPYDSHSSSYPAQYSSMVSSSSSRLSGKYRGRRWNKHYCDIVVEEGGSVYDDDNYYGDKPYYMQCKCFISVLVFGLVFGGFCLIIWGASRPFNAQITVKSLTVDNLYYGEGSDRTGVPTKLLTMNCSASMVIHNPATFFGIHVSSQTVTLFYSEIVVAIGQLQRYYQPRKSTRITAVRLIGEVIPLYGTGMALAASDESDVGIPFKLEFEIQSRGYLVGKLMFMKLLCT
ncbi:hypothetical protein BUALT_Bualt16G0066900 [Buddleja alternifolia]|uniref:Late embryogenesis abundant protein LEA-2 subgroup domain-containing protein n=1 Tax=Buddleja alternifolia TaxID=168488 RepID=A0AAV6WBF1_9LAMI|nr:hypothetical protein BUALT_Bualt16G0066900 [Buddleja alternifolia]